jgi:hypothetical protein
MTEAPFLPRERLFKQQQFFQNLTKHTYLKGRYDVVTSVAIPLALAATSMFMIVSFSFQPMQLLLFAYSFFLVPTLPDEFFFVSCTGSWSLQHVSWDWEKGVNFCQLTSVFVLGHGSKTIQAMKSSLIA